MRVINGMTQLSRLFFTNPHYIGDLVQNRSTTVSVTSKKRKIVEPEKQIIVKNTHEAIIPSNVFNAVQQQMKIRTKFITAPKKHLFTNILFVQIVEKECGTGVIVKDIYVGIMHDLVKKHAVVIPLKKIY